ncbi:glycosyltransferase family 9 protein [Pseudonocardia oroxyli]|uniref:ADP-heptose:LPS heptosyltransferase n=1 Tax=Pseudonocardia oroxyli TaxID=366584 RepID=A0A1G7XRI6_PSEOR|nr:glycosyltransferase family 9 protein [Pseudonocardia oroxyli]SDG86835.1 ADP-heptose:LPS heptosyltransferase [Pseudonocardia oroxyli]
MPDRILVVELLGGLGDLVMALPVVHGLAARFPRAELRVLTHDPGAALLDSDPTVTEVLRAARGAEPEAVAAALDDTDLVVSTTRLHGIPELVAEHGTPGVTDLWRSPPPDEPVSRRYVRILAAEGLLARWYRPPRLHLTAAEVAAADAALPSGVPTVLVPGAGMSVKVWPHWAALCGLLDAPVVAVGPGTPAPELPPTDLRGLAARFAAVGCRGGTVIGGDTGPTRVAAAAGARTVGLFGPTLADRYGLDIPGVSLQGLPGCPHRLPTAITEQVCWWEARCPLAPLPACLVDLSPAAVAAAATRRP